MGTINTVTISGRLTKNARINEFSNGDTSGAYFDFTVAVDKRMSKDAKEKAKANNKPVANFIPVNVSTTSDGQIKFFKENLKQGTEVTVSGEITTGSYTDKDGKTVYTTVITANLIDIHGTTSNSDDSAQNTQAAPQNTSQTAPATTQTQPQTAPVATPAASVPTDIPDNPIPSESDLPWA